MRSSSGHQDRSVGSDNLMCVVCYASSEAVSRGFSMFFKELQILSRHTSNGKWIEECVLPISALDLPLVIRSTRYPKLSETCLIYDGVSGEDILRRLTPLSGLQADILQRLGLGATLYGQLEIQAIGT